MDSGKLLNRGLLISPWGNFHHDLGEGDGRAWLAAPNHRIGRRCELRAPLVVGVEVDEWTEVVGHHGVFRSFGYRRAVELRRRRSG